MSNSAAPLRVTQAQRDQLQRLASAGATAPRPAAHCRIILLAAKGVSNRLIAKQAGVSRPTVILWRRRFREGGVQAILHDFPRPGRPSSVGPEMEKRIVQATLHSKPPDGKRWTTRAMAEAQGLNRMAVLRIWKKHHLKPRRLATIKR